MSDFLEIHTPWWLNNLIRWTIGMVVSPVYLAWRFLYGVVQVRAIFSGGSEILGWPWEWDWVDGL